MKHHAFGRMAFTVTNVGFGAWQIGGSWGDISEADGRAALNAALDAGMTFIDTADVYGDGRSEKIIADVLKSRGGKRPMITTNPHYHPWHPKDGCSVDSVSDS
ncbi:aldo/keto reductase, partial [Rhizobium ruizarguesonis]